MRILVVESDPIIALNLQALVLDLGQRPICPADTLDEIERLVADKQIDAAIIDVGNGHEERLALGRRLSECNISVIFTTTLQNGRTLGVPGYVLHKPYPATEIRNALTELIEEHHTYAAGLARKLAKTVLPPKT